MIVLFICFGVCAPALAGTIEEKQQEVLTLLSEINSNLANSSLSATESVDTYRKCHTELVSVIEKMKLETEKLIEQRKKTTFSILEAGKKYLPVFAKARDDLNEIRRRF